MAEANKADTIRRIFAAYLANDRQFVENAFSDDFRFTSPYDDALDKPAYFERCWNNSAFVIGTQLVLASSSMPGAMLQYPSGSTMKNIGTM